MATNQENTVNLDKSNETAEIAVEPDNNRTFPIAGIGASAGGLDAFERFFRHLPLSMGVAYVVMQHIDPTHDSLLADLLQRFTEIPVSQVTDGIIIKPNHIYVAPPGQNLALLNGKLHLMQSRLTKEQRRLPIDFFFRSLADDQQDGSIGVILSGNGTDGTLGLKAIKGAGGLAMVQTPESATYAGMPLSAVNTDIIDFILPPEAMGEHLERYVQHAFVPKPRPAPAPSSKETDAREKSLSC